MEGNNVKVFPQIWNIYPQHEALSVLYMEIKIFLRQDVVYTLLIQIFFPDQEGIGKRR